MTLCAAALTVAAKPKSDAPKPMTSHVVMIILDGWGAYSWDKANMPAAKALAAKGAYTKKMRTVLPSSSAMNWNSMFKGVGTEQHGYLSNEEEPQFTPTILNEHGIFPTIFSELRRQKPDSEIGVVYEWGDIKYFVDTLALNYIQKGHTDFSGEEPGLCTLAEKYIKEKKPTLFAVCYDQPDHSGHHDGHRTPAYYETIAKLDKYIARIVQATKDAGIYNETTFIVTADHGGLGKGHGGTSMDEMETMFILSGKGIKKMGEFPQQMMRYDTAATVAALLGYQCPQVWTSNPPTWAFK